MIDSGAQISIISPDLVKTLHLPLTFFYGHVHGVGQNKLIGQCQLPCTILQANINVNVDLYIMPSFKTNQIIFGLDFLEKYQCVIHCQKRALYINHTYVSFVICKQNNLYKQPKQVKKQVNHHNKKT
jgi:hypothetical protein